MKSEVIFCKKIISRIYVVIILKINIKIIVVEKTNIIYIYRELLPCNLPYKRRHEVCDILCNVVGWKISHGPPKNELM